MVHSIVNNMAPEYLTLHFVRLCDSTTNNLRENEYKLAITPALNFIKEAFLIAKCVVEQLASGGAATNIL